MKTSTFYIFTFSGRPLWTKKRGGVTQNTRLPQSLISNGTQISSLKKAITKYARITVKRLSHVSHQIFHKKGIRSEFLHSNSKCLKTLKNYFFKVLQNGSKKSGRNVFGPLSLQKNQLALSKLKTVFPLLLMKLREDSGNL